MINQGLDKVNACVIAQRVVVKLVVKQNAQLKEW